MSKYESPILAPLGEMAKGSGVCDPGSGVVAPACEPGVDAPPLDCSAGSTATRDCTAGVDALNACTEGTSAVSACTAGIALT